MIASHPSLSRQCHDSMSPSFRSDVRCAQTTINLNSAISHNATSYSHTHRERTHQIAYHQFLPGHIRRLIRRQKDHGIRHFRGFAKPSHRNMDQSPMFLLLRIQKRHQHLGPQRARTQIVESNLRQKSAMHKRGSQVSMHGVTTW